MKKRYKLNMRKAGLKVLVISCIVTAGAFTGCSIKEKQPLAVNSNISEEVVDGQEINDEEQKETDEETVVKNEVITDETGEAVKNDEFHKYIDLIGEKKEALKDLLQEEAKNIDEGGLEFEKAQIRVWLSNEGLVNQVFTMNKAIDFKGVKIGEDIKKFIEVFGEAVSDNNGDAHFKYNNVYVSVNYDSQTGETYAVYILKEDF